MSMAWSMLALPGGLIQQAVELGLHLGIARVELVAFIFAEDRRYSCSGPWTAGCPP